MAYRREKNRWSPRSQSHRLSDTRRGRTPTRFPEGPLKVLHRGSGESSHPEHGTPMEGVLKHPRTPGSTAIIDRDRRTSGTIRERLAHREVADKSFILRRLSLPPMQQIRKASNDQSSRTAMHGEHPRQMRPTPILLVAGRLRVVDGEQFHNASNDEIQHENSAEHNPPPLQVAALHRRRHHPTVRRGIDW